MDKNLSANSLQGVIDNEFNMPAPRWLNTYPAGPYRFINREFFIIAYETDPDLLQAILPPDMELLEPVVKFEFIRMPDSTGFGDYTESGQVVPVRYKGEEGGFTISMFLIATPQLLVVGKYGVFQRNWPNPNYLLKKTHSLAFSNMEVLILPLQLWDTNIVRWMRKRYWSQLKNLYFCLKTFLM